MARLITVLLLVSLVACGARSGLDVTFSDAGARDAGPPCHDLVPTAYASDSWRGLYRYDPRMGVTTPLGTPSCPMSDGVWTMTASRQHAFLVDDLDWSIYAVDLATMACARTGFDANALGLQPEFGVAATGAGASERVYVYGLPAGGTGPTILSCDARLVCSVVGPVSPTPMNAFPVNLTFNESTQHLFGFAPQLPAANVLEIDPASAAVLRSYATGVTTMSTWATFAYGNELQLWVGTDVVGYDLDTRMRTTMQTGAPLAVGASAFVDCR